MTLGLNNAHLASVLLAIWKSANETQGPILVRSVIADDFVLICFVFHLRTRCVQVLFGTPAHCYHSFDTMGVLYKVHVYVT